MMAAWLDTPYIEGAFEDLPGKTYTWNDVHSDYRTIWCPQIERVWRDEGGEQLLKDWGY